MSEHTCHAIGCQTVVSPKRFMCGIHWRMVPNHLRAAIWELYVPGQEIRKDPSSPYLEAARAAVEAVAAKETV